MSTWSTPMELEIETSAWWNPEDLEIGDEVKLEYTMKGQVHRDIYEVKAATPNNNGGCRSTVYRMRLQRREFP